MKQVILYSGGMDSHIGAFFLQQQGDWELLYVNLCLPYSDKELTHIAKRQRIQSVTIWDGIPLLQRGDHIPQRNVLLCTRAMVAYGNDVSAIALCSVADDVYSDNSVPFHRAMSSLLSLTAGHPVRVFSPLRTGIDNQAHNENSPLLTKEQAVAEYLKYGGDPETLKQTVSCYSGEHTICGECTACKRHASALEANGL